MSWPRGYLLGVLVDLMLSFSVESTAATSASAAAAAIVFWHG